MAKKRSKKKGTSPSSGSPQPREKGSPEEKKPARPDAASKGNDSPPDVPEHLLPSAEDLLWDRGHIPEWTRKPWVGHLRKALWAVIALCGVAFFYVWKNTFPLDEMVEVKVKLVLVVMTLALISLRMLQPASRTPMRKAGKHLVAAAAIAVIAYYNFGAFHGHTFVHYWEQFHYSINAKYFTELGHDGLYAASIKAQQESHPEVPLQPVLRDLRTNEMVQTLSQRSEAHRIEVKERFERERWDAFVEDHRHFIDINTPGYLYQIRRDHGFNPPPSWTFMARIFARFMPLDKQGLSFLGFLDVALLATLFFFVHRTYGPRVAAIALVIFGLNYAGRYYWVGGAFLREDWLAAVGIGICMMEKGRFRWAGACLGYAAIVRLFPVLFLFGPGIVALRSLKNGEWRWIRDLAIGFLIAISLGVGLGTLAGRGTAGWTEFADTISLHSKTWLTNNVGLENLILYEKQDWDRVLVDFSKPEPWSEWQVRMDQRKEDLNLPIRASQAALLLLLAAACWRARPSEAAVLSLACMFAMVLSTCYYWQALLVLAFLRSTRVLYTVLALNLGMCILHFVTPSFEYRYGLFSWGLLVLFLSILLPRAVAAFRGEPEEEEPEAVAAAT